MFVRDQRKSRPATNKFSLRTCRVLSILLSGRVIMRRDIAQRRVRREESLARSTAIDSEWCLPRDLLSRLVGNVETDDISHRIIFLSLSIARAAHQSSYSVPSHVPMCASVEKGKGTQHRPQRFHPDVFAVRSANGFRDTIEDSPAGVVVSLPVQ